MHIQLQLNMGAKLYFFEFLKRNFLFVFGKSLTIEVHATTASNES